MSWHYLQEQGEDFSLQNYLDGVRLERLRSKSTQGGYSSLDSATDGCLDSQSGTMSEHSTAGRGAEQLTLFLAGSRAKTLAAQAEGQGLPDPVRGFGESIAESLEKFGLALSLPKTPQCLELEDLQPSCKTLPRWGMTLGGACWALGTSAHHTNEIVCGSWLATPTAKANQLSPSMMKHPGCRAWTEPLPTPTKTQGGYNRGGSQGRKGKMRPSLAMMAKQNLWPPSWMDQMPAPMAGWGESGLAQMGDVLPIRSLVDRGLMSYREALTLTRGAVHRANLPPWREDEHEKHIQLNGKRYSGRMNGGHVNPEWIEWLMGWPIGWTGVGPLAMVRFQQWLLMHSGSFRQDGPKEAQ